MYLTKRLEALEAKAKAQTIEPIDVINVIVAPDRSIVGALRRGSGGVLVPVSDDELAKIRRDDEAKRNQASPNQLQA